ncbi:MAG: MBL fold metallo-hydrolase [bacterium]|nr:MBL fold metallo-hydrolase [bacterium]
MKVFIKRLVVSDFSSNCYIIGCNETKESVVIDPGGDSGLILRILKENDLRLTYIINTHGHIDHIGANSSVKKTTDCEVLLHKEDEKLLTDPVLNLSSLFMRDISIDKADRLLDDEDVIKVGRINLNVIHTPGHTPGSICLRIDRFLFTGDTLFASGVGRTDFPYGSHEALIKSIKTRLLILDGGIIIYPGHGEKSTIEKERLTNPFLT